MIREEFLRLATAGYNRIPMACETLADFDTPLSIYLKLADKPNSYLLESVQGGEKWGRYSIIGLPCRTVLRVHDHHVSITHDGVEIESHDVEDPLAFVETFKARYNVPTIPGLPRFNGGLVGYFGYDCVRYVEKRLGKCPNPDPLGVPDILLMVSDAVVVFDNLAGKMHAIVLADPSQADAFEQGQASLEALLEKLRQPITPRRGLTSAVRRPPTRSFVQALPRMTTSARSTPSRNTSLPVTACRWCRRNACPSTSRRRQLICTARCGASTRRRTCTSSTSETSTWWAVRRKCWCGSKTTSSPCAR